MSNRSSHFVRRFQTLRSALTGVSGSRRLLALAAVLALLALMLQPTAVQAQTVTTVWSATLNPVSTSVDSGLGCSNAASDSNAYCSSSSRLDDNSFDYDGTTYAFHELLLFPNGRLLLSFTTTPTEATVSDLVLNIGDSPFRLSKGNQTGGDIYWDNSGLTWTAGSDVAVTLTRVVLNPPPPVVVPPDWELIPDGLAPGSHFRLLFVTSGLYTAESTSINDYNRKVRFNAGRGHAALAAYASGFRAVGSTATVDAQDNTVTTHTDTAPGVPIYWVKGKKVADDYPDFYDGSWDEEREGRNVRGEALSRFSRRGLETSGVWTGTAQGGTGASGNTLGTSEVVMGLPNKNPGDYDSVTVAGPLNSDFMGDGEPDSQGGDLDFAPLYGLSQVFVVGGGDTDAVTTYVARDWGLIPDGQGVGARFRLLFVTSTTRSAGSGESLATLDSFVQGRAAAGHAGIQTYSSVFRALASFRDGPAFHTIENTSTQHSDSDKGVPIYWLDGKKVADDYADFYDGDWDEEAEGRNESGAVKTFSGTNRVWTGTTHGGRTNGTLDEYGEYDSHGIGATSVTVGIPNSSSSGNGPLSSGELPRNDNLYPYYALSGVFQVGGPLPADAITDLPPVPTEPRNLRMETCYVHSYQVTNDNNTPDDDTDDTTETHRRGIPLL